MGEECALGGWPRAKVGVHGVGLNGALPQIPVPQALSPSPLRARRLLVQQPTFLESVVLACRLSRSSKGSHCAPLAPPPSIGS